MKTTLKLSLIILVIFASCKKRNEEDVKQSCEKTSINLFSKAKDKTLGAQFDTEIRNSPKEYPILDSASNPKVYAYLYTMRNNILNTGKVVNGEEFAWKLRVIKDDNTLNAFCTPGGYIYIYTGIIKYLDNADQLAGVLGHEMAHADKRHSTEAISQQYGVDVLTSIVLGNDSSKLVEIAKGLKALSYSRCNETDADENSVIYLSQTSYNCAGAAGFFEKISASGGSSSPEFLSTHPSPDRRVEFIHEKADLLNCNKTNSDNSEYLKIKALL